MKNTTLFSLMAIVLIGSFNACRKADSQTASDETPAQVREAVITDLANKVILATYQDMAHGAVSLESSIQSFIQNGTETELTACRQAWIEVRKAWETSEGFLFGPVATENIDPRIDTWPVNFQDLDSVIQKNSNFDYSLIESLEDALRGFHPIEYILFGENGDKKAADFTQKEKDYLLALTVNLKSLCDQVVDGWNAGYLTDFKTPGAGSVYATQREVYEELVGAIAGICDEVANGKIMEPFAAKDPSLEESPFSQNSMVDFTNNLRSVSNIYFGNYKVDGKGLEDFVKLYNLSLHNKISLEIDAAIKSLENVSLPFGEAITGEAAKLQTAMDAINTLKETLETELLPLVQEFSAQ